MTALRTAAVDLAKRTINGALDRVLGPMEKLDPYMLHPDAAFEGFYTKIDLESGARIALINSRVPKGKQNRTMVHMTYVPPQPRDLSSAPAVPFQVTVFFDEYTYMATETNLEMCAKVMVNGVEVATEWKSDPRRSGTIDLQLGDVFTFAYTLHTEMYLHFELPNLFSFDMTGSMMTMPSDTDHPYAVSTTRVPWIPGDPFSTPAGRLVQLPLPIQWHVHTLDNSCEVNLAFQSDPSTNDQVLQVSDGDIQREVHCKTNSGMPGVPTEARQYDSGSRMARMHMEKNWALSFPTSYIWIQARKRQTWHRPPGPVSGESGICIAGGTLYNHVQAYLGSYISASESVGTITFAPPFATSVFGVSQLQSMDVTIDADAAECKMSVITDVWRTTKLEVFAKVHDKRTFFTLPAPLRQGHVEDYCRQSFDAVITVRVYKRQSWRGHWRLVDVTAFDGGSLEFGGDLHRNAQPLPTRGAVASEVATGDANPAAAGATERELADVRLVQMMNRQPQLAR